MKSVRTFLSILASAAIVAVTALVPTATMAVPPTGPAGAAYAGINVEVEAGTVLASDERTISLTATNASAPQAHLYNASSVVVLPHGVTYVAGSAGPSAPNAIGEPTIKSWTPDSAFPEQIAQVLIWPNFADLPLGAEIEMSFNVVADDALYPVGASYIVDAGVYANADERLVPRVAVPAGGGVPGVTRATAGGDNHATVGIAALELTKTNHDAENEVYRGQANTTSYSIDVTTAKAAGSNDVIVVDHVPAWYSVTECDNDCVIEIVEIDGEVFTQLTWNLGVRPQGTTVTLTYSAFVGLQQITAPDGESTGAPTRPAAEGTNVKNTVTATGTYTGAVAEETSPSISASAEESVVVLDLGVVKTTSRGDFFAGETADFTLNIRTSEYISSAGIVVTDTLPDGLCPLIPAGVEVVGNLPVDCEALDEGAVSGATMTKVVANADGTFTLTLLIPDAALNADQDATITYTAFMRGTYHNGSNTSSGDVAQNVVTVSGVTTPVALNSVDTGDVENANGSAASLEAAESTIEKTIWTNPERRVITGAGGLGETCFDSDPAEYVGSDGPRLQLGDVACFRIRVDFADGASTRDAVVTDFLPLGTELIDWAVGPENTATAEPASGDGLSWLVGELNPADNARYVLPGGVLVLDLLVRVTDVPDAGADIDVIGNLAKLRYTNGDGRVMAARDEVDFELAPVAPLSLSKTVNNVETLMVQEGQTVEYSITVTHEGSAAGGTDYPLDVIEVQDELPAGFTCDDVSSGFECANGVITMTAMWLDFGSDGLLTPGETATFTYTLTIPQPLSISSSHTNTAAVTRYTAPTTDWTPGSSRDITFYPENPIDAYPDEEKNAPEASDTAVVKLEGASVAKNVTATSVDEENNDLLNQATIGELVTYTYQVTIPARTSVFNGVLSDALPTGRLVQVGDADVAVIASGVNIMGSCVVNSTLFGFCAATGTLTFPDEWTNNSDEPAVFTVSIVAQVAKVSANTHGISLTNTASFHSTPTKVDALPVSRGTASQTVIVVEPAISLEKKASESQVAGGSIVAYTLTASNAAGRSTLHDAVVVDCVPSELILGTLPAHMTGPVPGAGINGCFVGTQMITWTLPTPLVGGATQSIQYTVTVPASAPAAKTYENVAKLSGSSLSGDDVNERGYSATANHAITVNRPGLTKTASKTVVVPGESLDWTITATIPANVTMYNAAFVDVLPAAFPQASVTGWEITCDSAWATTCPTATLLTRSLTTHFGVSLGTIQPAAVERTVTLTLTTKLPTTNNTGNGVILMNTVDFRWNFSEAAVPPATTGGVWNATQNANAIMSVRHPSVTVAKSVSRATPAQGEIFTYTVTATAANTVAAHNVKIVDTVPVGIVVLDASNNPLIDRGSTKSGAVWNEGARTLTWTVTLVAQNSIQTFSYPARLSLASQLDGSALRNSVVPASWDSLATGGKTYAPGAAATATVTPQFPKIDAVKTQVSPSNPVYIGQEVAFRFVLTNNGSATAASLDAVDTLPTGWSFVADSAQVTVRSGAAQSVQPSVNGQALRWNDIGGAAVNLQRGESIVVMYRAVAGATVGVGMTVAHTNTVVAADVTDATGGTSFNGGAGSYIGTSGTASALIASADLSVTKVANDDFVAGQTGTYTITVTNNGPDAAAGVSVVDSATLPDGVELLGGDGEGWTCTTPVADELACTRVNPADTLAPQASWVFIVSASVASDVVDGTEIPNTATVASRTKDTVPGNNSSTGTAIVNSQADLRIAKVATEVEAIAGLESGIGWTITVTNAGPSVSRGSDAAPIIITDVLPADVTDVTIGEVTDGVACAVDDGTFTCTIPFDVAVGDSVVVNLSATVDSAITAGTVISNTATVGAVTPDPIPANNISTITTPVNVQESLTVDKSIISPTDDLPVAGGPITYRIVVTNGGPSDARGVTVLDVLPGGVTYESIVEGSDEWSATTVGDDVRFDLAGTLPTGSSSQFDITVQVEAGIEGDIINTVTVSSDWRDDQDDSSVSTGSRASADLSIVKSIDLESIVAGAETPATYTLTVTNAGPSDAAGPITVTDLLPAGMTVAPGLSAECTVADASGRSQVTCEKADGLDLTEGAWIIEIPVLVEASVTANTLTNTATVSSPTEDPTPLNNTSSVPVDVLHHAALTVIKEGADSAVAGENVTWTVTVSNNGPSDAQTVTLLDALDSRLALVEATSETEGVSCEGNPTLMCSLGTLAPGESIVITIVTTVASSVQDGDSILNTAVATSTTTDPATNAPATDEDDKTVVIETRSALTITKDTVADQVDAGGVAQYSIVVGNTGPSDAAAPITLVDTLPAGESFLAANTAAANTEWNCDIDAQILTCVLEADGVPVSLAAGALAPALEISAVVAASLGATTLTNIASVTSPGVEEPVVDEAEIHVVTHADLELIKSHSADATAIAGGGFSWTIQVINHGPSDSEATAANPIIVRDVLPAGVTLSDEVVSGGADISCAAAGEEGDSQVIECLITSTIAAGGSVAMTLNTVLASSVQGEIVNSATVTAGLTPQPAEHVFPDTDDDTVLAEQVADLAIAKQLLTESIVAGTQISWAVSVTNLGPSDSHVSADAPITVVDTLPLGVSATAIVGDGWTCDVTGMTDDGRETIVCTSAETLPFGQTSVITVTGDLGSAVQGSVVNEVVVTPGLTPQPEIEVGPDTASVTGVVTESADVVLTKLLVQDVVAGGTGTYRFQLVNLGPSDARDIVIRDTLPAGLSFASIAENETSEAWACAPSAEDSQTLECRLDGLLVAGSTMTLDVVVDADQNLQGEIANTATVESSTPDPELPNNTSVAVGVLAEQVDLSIVKQTVGTPVVGETIDYTLAVANAGPSLARGIVVTDVVPAQLAVESVSAEGWSCSTVPSDAGSTTVTCVLDELEAGAYAPLITITARVLPAAYPTISNTAVVTSATPEAVITLGDNSSTVTDVVPALSDLAITKELNGTLEAGKTGEYIITVTNNGPTEDPGPVTVTDQLPAELSLSSASVDGHENTCEGTGQTVTCELGSLDAGESVTVTVLVTVAADASGTIVNVATVASETDPESPQATASGEVVRVDVPVDPVDPPDPTPSPTPLPSPTSTPVPTPVPSPTSTPSPTATSNGGIDEGLPATGVDPGKFVGIAFTMFIMAIALLGNSRRRRNQEQDRV